MANITNRERHPYVDWVSDEEIRKIGDIGGIPLVLLGFEDGLEGKKSPVVARSYASNPLTEELFAIPIYELMNSQDPITITEEF